MICDGCHANKICKFVEKCEELENSVIKEKIPYPFNVELICACKESKPTVIFRDVFIKPIQPLVWPIPWTLTTTATNLNIRR